MSLHYYQVAGIVATGVWLALWAFERSTLPTAELPVEKPTALPSPLTPPLPPFFPNKSPPEATLPSVKTEVPPEVRLEPVTAPPPVAAPELPHEPPPQALPEPTLQIPPDFRRHVLPEPMPPVAAGLDDYPHEPEWIMYEEPEPDMETNYEYEEPPVQEWAPPRIPDPFEAGF